jgi:hypothetical protein
MDILPKKIDKFSLYEPILNKFYTSKTKPPHYGKGADPGMQRHPSVSRQHIRSSTRLNSFRAETPSMQDGRESKADFSRFNEELENMVQFRSRDTERNRLQSAR